MKDYATIPYTSGAFPNVVSQNESVPGAADGTPYIKDVIDDLWGARQALMSYGSLTPTGVTESATTSQTLEAIRRITGYPGEMISYMGVDTDPSAVGIRLLPLTGQGILRVNYPDLDAAVYVGAAQNPTAQSFYHADDAAGTIRNPSGIYLILPDLRGRTARGLDPSGLRDADGPFRDIGGKQDDAVVRHRHYIYEDAVTLIDPLTIAFRGFSIGTDFYYNFPVVDTPKEVVASDLAADMTKDAPDNRMDNVACTWCIRY